MPQLPRFADRQNRIRRCRAEAEVLGHEYSRSVVPLNRQELERKVCCPKCARPLSTHPYFGPGNVVIDNCETCELVWLDFGELGQIVDAPGKDRGTREMPQPAKSEPFGNTITGARVVGAGVRPDDLVDGNDLLTLLARLF